MAEQTGECWMVWVRQGFLPDTEWFPWEHTARDYRAASIAAISWWPADWYPKARKRGVAKCVRTTLTARLP